VNILSDPRPIVRVLLSFAVGAAGGAVTGLLGYGQLVPLVTWDIAAAIFCIWMWATVLPLDCAETSRRASAEDPGRKQSDVLLLTACIASLGAVGLLLVQAAQEKGAVLGTYVGLGVLSVVCSWTVVHTLYALHYAHLYYSGVDGGIDFNCDDPPSYADFAYLAFTIGMTFQVSDTSLQTREFRATALKHALLSYLFGTVIVATVINLVAGLTK